MSCISLKVILTIKLDNTWDLHSTLDLQNAVWASILTISLWGRKGLISPFWNGVRGWFTAVMVWHSTGPHTPDVDLTPENLSDIPKATKEASMDKRQENYPGGFLSWEVSNFPSSSKNTVMMPLLQRPPVCIQKPSKEIEVSATELYSCCLLWSASFQKHHDSKMKMQVLVSNCRAEKLLRTTKNSAKVFLEIL